MPLHHAVLALLSDKPAHGYELKNSFEQAVGDQWGGLNIGHLYQILDRRPGVRSADPAALPAVLSRQRAHLLRQLHALAAARATTSTTAVESLLITAAELHIRADLGVVDAAEKTLTTDPAAPAASASERSSRGITPPQSEAS